MGFEHDEREYINTFLRELSLWILLLLINKTFLDLKRGRTKMPCFFVFIEKTKPKQKTISDAALSYGAVQVYSMYLK